MASKAAVASRSPISKINSRTRSPVRADSKAANRADSRTDNNFRLYHVLPQRECWGSFFIVVDPLTDLARASRTPYVIQSQRRVGTY